MVEGHRAGLGQGIGGNTRANPFRPSAPGPQRSPSNSIPPNGTRCSTTPGGTPAAAAGGNAAAGGGTRGGCAPGPGPSTPRRAPRPRGVSAGQQPLSRARQPCRLCFPAPRCVMLRHSVLCCAVLCCVVCCAVSLLREGGRSTILHFVWGGGDPSPRPSTRSFFWDSLQRGSLACTARPHNRQRHKQRHGRRSQGRTRGRIQETQGRRPRQSQGCGDARAAHRP